MFNRQKIIDYIEDKHLPDGGYFFGKVEPSGGYDTLLAVKTLSALDVRPKNSNSIVTFYEKEGESGNLDTITGLFFAVETMKALGEPINRFQKYGSILKQDIHLFERHRFNMEDTGSIGLYETSAHALFTEFVEAELKELYYFVSLSRQLDMVFDTSRIIDFVLSGQNTDGGFGNLAGSQLATTYYALQTLQLLDYVIPQPPIFNYLNSEWMTVSYLEDLFWLIESLSLIGKRIPNPQYVDDFLTACWRDNGGFSRSRTMGISTIEYTFFAVQLLVRLQKEMNVMK